MSEAWQRGEEPVYMWKRDRLSTCVCNLIKLQRVRALLTTLGYVYNKLDFETSKAQAILASCWPLQGDFMISPDQFFVCLDWFLCGSFQVWFSLILKLSDVRNDLESGVDRNLDEAC